MRSPFLIVLAVFAGLSMAACDRSSAPEPAPVSLEQGTVAADMPAAKAIGEAVLAEGGSAIDAAIATVLALGVENPSSSGLGGGGFAVVWDAEERRAYALDFRERAPKGASPGHYRGPEGAFDPRASQRGCYAAGVPGEAAGLDALHARFGRLPWSRLVEPAERLASDGVPVSPYLAKWIAARRSEIEARPSLARVLLKNAGGERGQTGGEPYREGELVRDLELADTLAVIGREGGSAFYRGGIAAAIQAACRDVDGAIRAADLAEYSVVWRTPLTGHWRDSAVVTMPPPSAGGVVLLEILNMLEPAEWFDRSGPDGALSYHLLAEAMKHGFADRATAFGDPDFVPVPVRRLTSKAYAAGLLDGFDPERTQPRWAYGRPGAARNDGLGIPTPPDLRERSTSNVSAVDARGNAIAITTSVNGIFGSMVRAPQAGILLNNTLDDFSLDDAPNLFGLVGSKKNRIAPGKRPVSSMTPVIVLEEGRVRLVAGGAGGPTITTGTLQTVLGVLVEGRTIEASVGAPRIHHQWLPETLYVEPGIDEETIQALTRRGHQVEEDSSLAVIEAVEVRDNRAFAADDHRKRIRPAAAKDPAPVEAAPEPIENRDAASR